VHDPAPPATSTLSLHDALPIWIMDQFTVALARAGHALLLDCRDLSYRHIPIPDGVTIVVSDSHVERRLASSGYNERHAACEEARSEEHTSELQSPYDLVCRLLL